MTAQLSHRQQQVLTEVRKGLRDKEIARALHVKPCTVRYHIQHIFKKLGVRSRLQATLRVS